MRMRSMARCWLVGIVLGLVAWPRTVVAQATGAAGSAATTGFAATTGSSNLRREFSSTVSLAEELARTTKEVELYDAKLSTLQLLRNSLQSQKDAVAKIEDTGSTAYIQSQFNQIKAILAVQAAQEAQEKALSDQGSSQAQPHGPTMVENQSGTDVVPEAQVNPMGTGAEGRLSPPAQPPDTMPVVPVREGYVPRPADVTGVSDGDETPLTPGEEPPRSTQSARDLDAVVQRLRWISEILSDLKRSQSVLDSRLAEIEEERRNALAMGPTAAAPVAAGAPVGAVPWNPQSAQLLNLIRGLRSALGGLAQSRDIAIQNASIAITSLSSTLPTLSNPSSPVTFAVAPSVTPIGGFLPLGSYVQQQAPGGEEKIPRYFPETASLIALLEQGFRPEEEAIHRADDELKDIVNTLRKYGGSDLAARFTDIENTLDKIILKMGQERDDKRDRMLELEAELKNRDDLISQSSINYLLVFAVYGMIAAIGVLFVSLVFIKGGIARRIIQDRLLVEVLSMGFLLLTVIILGTGKLLNPEGLAALLGTIAGYIFARKAAEMAGAVAKGTEDDTDEEDKEDRHDQPEVVRGPASITAPNGIAATTNGTAAVANGAARTQTLVVAPEEPTPASGPATTTGSRSDPDQSSPSSVTTVGLTTGEALPTSRNSSGRTGKGRPKKQGDS